MRLAWGARVDASFRQKAVAVATNIGCDPSHLMACMAFETGETFSPSVRNPNSSATGLIQFMTGPDSWAVEHGYTRERLMSMTPVEQLDVVAEYFEPYRGRLRTLADVYMAILWPKAVGLSDDAIIFGPGSRAYLANRGLDLNNDGAVSKSEAAAHVAKKLAKGLLPGNVFDGAEAPAPETQPAAPIEERVTPPLPQPTPERKPMAPLIPVILKLLAGALPVVSTIFGPRGEISERNVKLAQVVVDTAVRATDSINAQEAAEKIAADADAAARANAALAAQPDIAAYLAVVSPIIERQAAYEAQARTDSRGDTNDAVIRKNPALITPRAIAWMIFGAMILIGLAMLVSLAIVWVQAFQGDGRIDAFVATIATLAVNAIASMAQSPFRAIFGILFTSEAASTAGGVVDTSRQQLGAKQ
jgi:hypothetical protein